MIPNTFVYEFLYRGKPDGTDAFHVQLGQVGTDAFGSPLPNGPVMSAEAALAAGVELPDIIKTINLQVMADLEALKTEITGVKLKLETAEGRAERAEAERDKAKALYDEQSRVAAELSEMLSKEDKPAHQAPHQAERSAS